MCQRHLGVRVRVLLRSLENINSVLTGGLMAFDKLFNLVWFIFDYTRWIEIPIEIKKYLNLYSHELHHKYRNVEEENNMLGCLKQKQNYFDRQWELSFLYIFGLCLIVSMNLVCVFLSFLFQRWVNTIILKFALFRNLRFVHALCPLSLPAGILTFCCAQYLSVHCALFLAIWHFH